MLTGTFERNVARITIWNSSGYLPDGSLRCESSSAARPGFVTLSASAHMSSAAALFKSST